MNPSNKNNEFSYPRGDFYCLNYLDKAVVIVVGLICIIMFMIGSFTKMTLGLAVSALSFSMLYSLVFRSHAYKITYDQHTRMMSFFMLRNRGIVSVPLQDVGIHVNYLVTFTVGSRSIRYTRVDDEKLMDFLCGLEQTSFGPLAKSYTRIKKFRGDKQS